MTQRQHNVNNIFVKTHFPVIDKTFSHLTVRFNIKDAAETFAPFIVYRDIFT